MPKFKNNHIGFNVSNKLKQKTEEVSTEHEMSLAEFVRYVLQKYIDDYEKAKNKKDY